MPAKKLPKRGANLHFLPRLFHLSICFLFKSSIFAYNTVYDLKALRSMPSGTSTGEDTWSTAPVWQYFPLAGRQMSL